MSYAYEVNGLDLFTMPFRSPQACRAAPAPDRGTARSVPGSGKSASRMQKEKPTAPRSNKTVFSSQPADPKPLTEQAENARAAEPVQEQKPPAENPEPGKKQPSEDIQRNLYDGIGKPELLKGNLSGW